MDNATIARLVHYSGRVQGVGFRATTHSMARRFAVTGYVRNLSDGRVEVLVEGAPAEIDRFLQAVRDYWRDYLDDEQVEPREPTGRFHGFQIAPPTPVASDDITAAWRAYFAREGLPEDAIGQETCPGLPTVPRTDELAA